MYILKFEFKFENTGSTLVFVANTKSTTSVLTLNVVTCKSGMVLGSSWPPTRYIYKFLNASSSYSDLETMANVALIHRDYVFICVDVFLDGKRAGRHGMFMRVGADMACKDILNLFLIGRSCG